MNLTIGIVAVLGSVLVSAAKNSSAALPQISTIVPGIYLVEFADDHVRWFSYLHCRTSADFRQDNSSFYNSLRSSGITVSPRMHLNHSMFQGASFKITDIKREKSHVSKISTMPAVKQLWPIRRYSTPKPQRRQTRNNPNGKIYIDEQETQRKDAFSTHAMTQVDRLHAQGCKTHLGQVSKAIPDFPNA